MITQRNYKRPIAGWLLLFVAMLATVLTYASGLSGGYIFDDYPNIVENAGVHPTDASLSSLTRAALSSPASEFKRPLVSLSFATNYLLTGLDPYWMKLTNLMIHLLNGLLVFLLARLLLVRAIEIPPRNPRSSPNTAAGYENNPTRFRYYSTFADPGVVAGLVATSWMLLPINLTAVLYVVQRMESMANLFVLLGLVGYVVARRKMLQSSENSTVATAQHRHTRGLFMSAGSIIGCTAVGVLAKETAVMLPFYALLTEWILFQFKRSASGHSFSDRRVIGLFVAAVALPMILGAIWLYPLIFNESAWASRDFTLGTRLLSESRIVIDYLRWTVLPTPYALSFYHDDFRISTGLLVPWSTLASCVILSMLVGAIAWCHSRLPLVALGLSFFLACQLLTGTVLPLELIYEHRNYFASFGIMLALVPLLAVRISMPWALPRYALMGGLLLCWTGLTAATAYAWGNPLRLATDLASRAPMSPRAQYELGRTYVIYSHYNPESEFSPLAFAQLKRASALPESTILPEQALIFFSARMHQPQDDAWWDRLISKLEVKTPGVQDVSSLDALARCEQEHQCELSHTRLTEAFLAALSHPEPGARLLAIYGGYAWNVLENHPLGERMVRAAIDDTPTEPAYRITLIRMLAAQGRDSEGQSALVALEHLNIGGRLDNDVAKLKVRLQAR